jgi:hypothetical protein
VKTVDVGELSLQVAEKIAPDQLTGVQAFIAAHGDDLSEMERVASDRQSDEMGFGVGDVASLSAAIVALCAMAVTWLGRHVAAAVDAEIGGRLRSLVRHVFVGTGQAKARKVVLHQPLSRSQLAAVRQYVYEQAPRVGMEATHAALVADAVVGALALWPEAGHDQG